MTSKRLSKKWIPKNTDYCYEVVGREENGCLKTKTCPYYKRKGTNLVYCEYTNVSSDEDVLLLDFVKTCGVNMDEGCEQ
ncbi:hypothetical protein [Geobacillus subterraneus]|uniref:Uncharacterized protein n=1 Tax=Geobacillus subterraneus TaxID=129338 RepID=A0A679G188_9BACL|nr:hypothetical protein [Geobacillus subterraneus]BBW98874.1 hypothetical protein GsuE55_37070 [Geobacillus subterraneus]